MRFVTRLFGFVLTMFAKRLTAQKLRLPLTSGYFDVLFGICSSLCMDFKVRITSQRSVT